MPVGKSPECFSHQQQAVYKHRTDTTLRHVRLDNEQVL
jgi:hypothetical protein